MNFENLDINSIIIVVIAICIGLIKVIEIYKSGSYRNTKLNNSKEQMKQVETLKNKYREKFKNNIKDIKNDMIKEIKNKKFNNDLENINESLDKLIKIYNDTNTLLTSSSTQNSEKQSLENTSDSVDIEIQK